MRVKKDNPNKGLSPRMVEFIWTVLHAALKQAFQNGLVSRNVADGVKKPRKVKQDLNLWTVEEANQFLNMLKKTDCRMFAVVLTALGTGARRSELLGLRWTDLDLKAGTMDIKQVLVPVKGDPGYKITPPKTKKSARTIALPEAVKKELEAWRKEQQKEKRWSGIDPDSYNPLNLVFTNEIGQPYSPHTVTHAFTRYRKESGLPPMRLHDMRQLHATTLLRKGADIKTIQEQLGHSTIATTGDFYLHVLDEAKRENARILDDALTV